MLGPDYYVPRNTLLVCCSCSLLPSCGDCGGSAEGVHRRGHESMQRSHHLQRVEKVAKCLSPPPLSRCRQRQVFYVHCSSSPLSLASCDVCGRICGGVFVGLQWKEHIDKAMMACNARTTSNAQRVGKWALVSHDFSVEGKIMHIIWSIYHTWYLVLW